MKYQNESAAKRVDLNALAAMAFALGAGWAWSPAAMGEPPSAPNAAEKKPMTMGKSAPAKGDAGKSETNKGDANKSEGGASEHAGPKGESKAESKAEAEAPGEVAEAKSAAWPKTADEAIKWLAEGNTRWVTGGSRNPNTDMTRRGATAEQGQKPFACLLTCADSRVPAERLFDRGVGDIFVVRVAGNVARDTEAGSLEYAIEHFHTPVLVVMGHTKCGAVAAAASGGAAEGNVGALVKCIEPAVERAKRMNPEMSSKDVAVPAVRENVWQSVFDLLKESPLCRAKVKAGDLKIVGAVYDIASGKVDWLGEHPWQKELLAALEAQQGSSGNGPEGNAPEGKVSEAGKGEGSKEQPTRSAHAEKPAKAE